MNIFHGSSDKGKNEGQDKNIETLPPVDAVIHVSVAADQLTAYINIEPPSNGGSGPTLPAMHTVLTEFNVSYNVDDDKLKKLVDRPIYDTDIVIARGLAPVDGTDGSATFLIKTEKNTLKPKDNENGTVDFRDLDIVENVKKGQVLCNIKLPTEGTPGISVRGRQLQQKKGRPVQSYLGKNTVLNEDGTKILSKIDGQVEFDGRKINVDETFYVKENVDNSTGNINVTGNLVVQGMVLPGFTIEAGGNIEIKGTSEDATIKAGGNIKLQSGIIGSKLTCGRNLSCRFIENSNIFVKCDIEAESIINSNVKCGKSIKITGPIAKIIGGSCVAGQNIEARSIGSISNAKTNLKLGTDEFVIERQQKLLTQVSDMESQNEKLRSLISILGQLDAKGRLTPDRKQVYENVKYSYESNLKQIEDAKDELGEIAESIKAKGYGKIVCTGTIYPGTTVSIGEANLSVHDTLTNSTLYYNKDEISVGIAH